MKKNNVQDIPNLIAGALGVSRGTAYDMMREALADATPVQQPMAWYRDEDGIRIYYESKYWDDATPLYTTPPAAPVQEPVAMRMPKVGDKVVCIEDESLGTVVYLTAGGSPEIKFDDGSHGTYMLREFAELFGYTTPPAAQRQWVGLTDEEEVELWESTDSDWELMKRTEAKLKEKNT